MVLFDENVIYTIRSTRRQYCAEDQHASLEAFAQRAYMLLDLLRRWPPHTETKNNESPRGRSNLHNCKPRKGQVMNVEGMSPSRGDQKHLSSSLSVRGLPSREGHPDLSLSEGYSRRGAEISARENLPHSSAALSISTTLHLCIPPHSAPCI